ncbi:MAG TPA: hypothetical protein VHR45_11030 [Thermoanaerobaculia bacterium]|nr:hypothetical protein [Thermoanaerobaculia bacterium]
MTIKKVALAVFVLALALVAKASAEENNLRLTTASGICDSDSPEGTLCVTRRQVQVENISGPCLEDDGYTLCLQGGRFRVRIGWVTPDGTRGWGHAVHLNNGSGTFWFFGPENSEMLVKVINACIPSLGNHWWVFWAATTNVQFELEVQDTTNTWLVAYLNDMNQAAMPVQDTKAFACP